MVELKPGDILIWEDTATGLYGKLKRYLLGSPWGHASLAKGDKMQIESVGRGVLDTDLCNSNGRVVAIMRLCPPIDSTIPAKAMNAALELSEECNSWYGYFDIPRYVLPRLIWQKLTGRREGFGYHRNPAFICSELVDQAYRNVGLDLFPDDSIPLPGDYETCPFLYKVWQGPCEV